MHKLYGIDIKCQHVFSRMVIRMEVFFQEKVMIQFCEGEKI